MTVRPLQRVLRESVRVALVATAVVGAAYLVVAVAVVFLVGRNMTADIDGQLRGTLDGFTRFAGPDRPPPNGNFDAPTPRVPFGAPIIVWTIHADGDVSSNRSDAVLPVAYRHVTGPETISIGTASVRVEGMAVGDSYVVVGRSTESVSQAQSTIILAELLIGPALLLVVFLGAVAIGRRVAAPIELARQRQLEFTADASHELRTPLSVIEAHTSLALARDRDEQWYRSTFRRLDGEVRRMRRLVEDMLWLARFDALQGAPQAEPVDVGVLAEQTVDRFRIVAETRSQALAFGPHEGSAVITAPPEWLDRLLGVLLDNACKYSPEGGAIAVTIADEGGRVRLTVDDSGPGIPPDERPRVFDRFHRGGNAGGGGAGLGLAIADAIVRATKGHWRIGSSPAGGASMSVIWARAFPNRRLAGAADRPDRAADTPGGVTPSDEPPAPALQPRESGETPPA